MTIPHPTRKEVHEACSVLLRDLEFTLEQVQQQRTDLKATIRGVVRRMADAHNEAPSFGPEDKE